MSEPTKKQLIEERDELARSINVVRAENRVLSERNQQLRNERNELKRTIRRLRSALMVVAYHVDVTIKDGAEVGYACHRERR